jgi:hypothetical protein
VAAQTLEQPAADRFNDSHHTQLYIQLYIKVEANSLSTLSNGVQETHDTIHNWETNRSWETNHSWESTPRNEF